MPIWVCYTLFLLIFSMSCITQATSEPKTNARPQEMTLDDEKRAKLWKRITNAIRSEDIALARTLALELPLPDQGNFNTWMRLYHNPSLLPQTRLKPTELGRTIVASTLAKLFHTHFKLAMKLWPTYRSKYSFTHEEEQRIIRSVALEYALQNDHRSQYWFSQLISDPNDTTVQEWKVRERIGHSDWRSVINNIQNMPDKLRAQPSWRYWLARAHLHLEHYDSAYKGFSELATERNYYGFLASHHIKIPPNLRNEIYNYRHTALNEILSHPLLQESKEAYFKGDIVKARNTWRKMLYDLDDDQRYTAAKIAQYWGWSDQAIFTARKVLHQEDLTLRFPIVYHSLFSEISKSTRIPLSFLFAIVRQESAFQTDALSSGGAVGLMQLLPSTAKSFSKRRGLRKPEHVQLEVAQTNLHLGSQYYNYLIKYFRGNYLLAAVAYNAGIGRVIQWKKHVATKDPTILIEIIPWQETRDYVKNIITYCVIYQYLLDEAPDVSGFFKMRN